MQQPISKTIAPLFTASFLAYGYNNIFMVITPLFALEIGASLIEAGLQGAVFLAVAIILRFYFGTLADRWGQKLIMIVGLTAFMVGGLLFMLCTEFWQMMGIRCVQAIGLSAFFPCATAMVANTVSSERIGFFLGAFRFVVSLSMLIGPWSATIMVELGGYGFCFAVMTILSAVALGLILILPAPFQATYKGERSGLQVMFTTFREAVNENPRVLGVVLGSTFVAALGYGLLLSFAALFITDVGPSLNSGLYFTLTGFGGLAANLVAGWISDKANRTVLLVGCLMCMGVGIVALGFLEASDAFFYISGCMAGLGYAGVITTVLALASAKTSETHRTSVLALQQNGIDLGIACASGGFGLAFAAASSASFVFIIQGTFMVFVAFIVVLSNRKDLS